MEITSLPNLLKEKSVVLLSNGINLSIPKSWVIEGENRLSYTSLIRLIECCREHHWNKDIQPFIGNSDLDSITKSLKGVFIRPILIGSSISITYSLHNIKSKGYEIHFDITDNLRNEPKAVISLVQIFYSPIKNKPIEPPRMLHEKLKMMQKKILRSSSLAGG